MTKSSHGRNYLFVVKSVKVRTFALYFVDMSILTSYFEGYFFSDQSFQ